MIIKDNGLEYKVKNMDIEDGNILVIKHEHCVSEEALNKFGNELMKIIDKDILPVFITNNMEVETLSDENLKRICKERGLKLD